MYRVNSAPWPLGLALLGLLIGTAHAGGPLIVDPNTQTGYHYAPSPIPVYYDLGPFGLVLDQSTNPPTLVVYDNAVGARLVRKGYASWSKVPTTSLQAKVQGNFALKGLPDINDTNITLIIGTPNGRGIYVVFDADGSIMQNFFGVSDGVLGISTPQYAIEGTTTITESFAVLNGAAVDPHDAGAAAFQGVATHEFGHSLGLAHSQVNGAAVFFHEAVGPASCTKLPYAGVPSRGDVETMYPYIDPTPGTGSGVGQGDVHTLDSMASISDLYPGAGWPGVDGTIEGKVYDLDGKTELTGVNVIARNLSAPYVGANSAISGQLTQGLLGPDGRFTIHGLVPGQQYVLYLDALVAGGYDTPPLWFLPGAEPFFATGSMGNGKYDPCRYSVITARAGRTTQAPIKFSLMPGAPILYQLGYGTGVTGLSGDGSIAVGNFGRGGPVFRWSASTGVVPMDMISTGEITSISHNGRYISSNLLNPNTDTALGAYRWDQVNGWQRVAPLGSCGTDTTSNFAVDDNGAVYGLAYRSCTNYKGFRWTPRAGTMPLKSPSLKPNGQTANTRVNHVSADGLTIVGWQEEPTGPWDGVVWNSGVPTLVRTPSGELVDEVTAVSSDGTLIAGPLFDGQMPLGNGYRRPARGTKMEWVKPLPGDASPTTPNALSGNGDVMAGFGGNPFLSFNPGPFIWTRELGTANLDDFVRGQGTAMEQWFSLWEPEALSDDGKIMGGWGIGYIGDAGWVLKIDKAFVCHQSNAAPGAGTKGKAKTLSVDFPSEFDNHLAHGDTVGRCRP